MRLNSGGYSVRTKVIVSGDVVELYDYENPVFKGYKSNGGRDKVADDESKEKNRKDTLRRARQDLRHTVNANVWAYGEHCPPKFLTLTFGDNDKVRLVGPKAPATNFGMPANSGNSA